ncbi:DUF6455 family protein [Palleronia abyssalis]|uniref:DUF6455 domain-containing protein n=1 Tax=Palleronia abyssalis TaxID=1501240 RepID=A0A2R8BYD0_9RHOB|nr:DUF6455 family protein [Palleronia abyssalis]SPJ25160.1 hypothetical protein PAA8504_03008 [Palleronia abyssalis]
MTADPHFRLVREMTEAVGIDRRHLDPEDLSDIVHRCRDCTHVGACRSWLADAFHDARHAPEFCVNKTRLDRIRDAEIAATLTE